MSDRSAFHRFLAELRRRHVPQTVAIYLVAAWAAIEFADVVVPNLDGPQWVITAVIVAAGVGLPVVLVLAWLFDWSPGGLHRTPDEPGTAGSGDTAGGGPTGPGAPSSATPTAPWVVALAVLAVGIGSALVVAALVSGGGEELGPDEPAAPPGLAPPSSGMVTAESIQSRVARDLERFGLGELTRLGDLEGIGQLGDMDSADLADLRDVLVRTAEASGVSVLVQEPREWRIGQGRAAPLPEGNTLVVRGLAFDSAGVVSVSLDGETIAETDDPQSSLRFTGRLVGTGDDGTRDVPIVVRTVDGREIRRAFPVLQRPPGGGPGS